MGIDISAKIIVGLHYEELMKNISEDELEGLLVEDHIEVLSPFYDAPLDSCSFGISVESLECYYSSKEIDENTLLPKITKAMVSFKNLIGVDGKVLLGAHVY